MKKSITRNSLSNIIYVGANLIFPLITSSYIARILLPDRVGEVAIAQNLASYFITFASLGLPSYGVREISKARADREELSRTFSELLFINIIASVLSSIAYLIVILTLNTYRNEIQLYLACGISVIFNVINVDWFYQGIEEYGYITKRSIFVKIVSLLLILMLVHKKEDYVIYALLVSLATVGNYVLNIINSRKYIQILRNGLNIKKHIKPLLVFALILLFSSIYSKIDVLMLGFLAPKSSAGFYTYAQKIINLVLSLCNAATTVFLPRLSIYYSNDKTAFNQLISKGINVIAYVSFPISAGLFALSSSIIVFLFGRDFVEASYTVKILLPLIIIKSFGDLLCYQVIISTGNEKQSIYASIVGSLINVTLNSILIPLWYEKGAALASVIAELALNLYEFIYVKHHVGYHIDLANIWKPFISSAIMGALVYLGVVQINSPIIKIIVGLFIGVISYFLLNIIFKNKVQTNFIKLIRKH